MFTTPQDYFKAVQESFTPIPKSVDEAKSVMDKAKKVVETETGNVKKIIATYNRLSTGDASMNELTSAQKTAKELFVATRFAATMAIPGAVFVLPALVKIADEYDFKFVPESVKKEFNI
jgi:hypothetical protein